MATLPPDDRRCVSPSRETGQRCKRWRHPGTTVCVKHGATAPRTKRKAARVVAERAAMGLLSGVTAEPIVDPLAWLAELAGEVDAFRLVMREKVDELRSFRYEDMKGAEQLRSEIAVYERALDRCLKTSSEIVRLNLAERMTKVTENHAALVRDAMLAAMREAELSQETQSEVMGNVARHLRAI